MAADPGGSAGAVPPYEPSRLLRGFHRMTLAAAFARRDRFRAAHSQLAAVTDSTDRRSAATEIAAALRSLTAADTQQHQQELEACLQACDDLVYAPDSTRGTHAPAELKARARALLDAMETGE